MKIYKKLVIAAFAVTMITIASCSRKGNNSTDSNNSTSYFKTQSEAVIRGKNDLVNILRSSPSIQIAVNAELLEKSQPGISLKHLEVDFDQLLKQDQINNFYQLKNSEKSTINTLIVENNVLTIIQTANSDKGWRVTGLADATLTNDLNEVLASLATAKPVEITLFEIENLQASIYAIKTTEGETYHTNYNGFSLKEGVSIEQLYPLLHNDALTLERTYGDELKTKGLVK